MPPVALITGANRGIGREVAMQLFRRGFDVFAGAREPERVQPTGYEHDERWAWCRLDVTSREQITSVADLIAGQHDHLDVLINNAAVMDKEPLVNGDIEVVRATMEVNFYGPMRLCNAMIPMLRNSRDARIINVSSEMGRLQHLTGGYAGYRLSKAGLNAQTILLSHELAGTSVKVNAVCPGWVRTDMGGPRAPGSTEEGADTIVWLATTDHCPNGAFVSNRRIIDW